MTARQVPRPSAADLSDAELDRYILTRLTIVGVDLSVLPVNDPDAPADQVRILRSARNFLRNTVPDLSSLDLGPEALPPILYPAALAPRMRSEPDGR